MGNSPVVAVAMFQSYQEASIAQASLAAVGIDAEVTGGVTADTMAYFGTATGGVRLLVAQNDAPRASQVLDSLAQVRQSPPAPPWRCSGCGEQVEGHFDLCWSCGAVRPEREAPPDEADGEIDRPAAARAGAMPSSEWPDSSIEDDDRVPGASESAEATIDRAWKAAILGIVLPPLLLYALVLLARVARTRSVESSWKFYVTLVIVAAMCLLWWAFFRFT
ncbi:MAG TPA: hypothetical protein VML55_03040 [Planctomycetaceae bacterium]|nr:hypothetical protein [Planctomycetaceae bacterium]